MIEILPALPPMNYDNLNRRIGELDDYPSEIPVAIIAIVLVVSTIFLVATLVVYAYIIFRLRKNIKILFPMAKILTGQATGSEPQEIKRVLLTLLEIPAGQHCPTTTTIETSQTRHNTCRAHTSPGHHFNWSYSGDERQGGDVNNS